MDKQIRFVCSNPSCGKRLKAPPEHAGQRARCSCGQSVIVPSPEPLPLDPAPLPPRAPKRAAPTRPPRPVPDESAGGPPVRHRRTWLVAGAVAVVLAMGLGVWFLTRSPHGPARENPTTDGQVASAGTTPSQSTPANDKTGSAPIREQGATKKQDQPTDTQPKAMPDSEPNKTEPKAKPASVVAWKEVRQFAGHVDAISSIAVSKDGKHLLSAGGGFKDHSLRLWDIRTGGEVRQFKGHTRDIDSAVFSTDSTRVLSGGSDGTIRLWDTARGKELQIFRGHQANRQRVSVVTSVALSPDGRWAVSGGDDGLRMWDTETGKEVRRFEGLTAPVNAVCFSPDGIQFVSASGNSETTERLRPERDNSLRLWDAKSGKLIREFKGHQYGIFSVAFSPDGVRLASGSGDKTVRLWDVKTGDELQCLTGHTGEVRSVAFSPDGQKLLSAGGWVNIIVSQKPGEISFGTGDDRTVRLWDLKSGKELHRWTDCQKGYRQGVAFSIDGNHALFCTAKHTVAMVEIAK
jgi:WD40 repeat protein